MRLIIFVVLALLFVGCAIEPNPSPVVDGDPIAPGPGIDEGADTGEGDGETTGGTTDGGVFEDAAAMPNDVDEPNPDDAGPVPDDGEPVPDDGEPPPPDVCGPEQADVKSDPDSSCN